MDVGFIPYKPLWNCKMNLKLHENSLGGGKRFIKEFNNQCNYNEEEDMFNFGTV